MEPPGTIFRITRDKQRHIVTELEKVEIHLTQEAMGRVSQKTQASMGTLVKALELDIKFDINAEQNQCTNITL